jgi:hypothetical protein
MLFKVEFENNKALRAIPVQEEVCSNRLVEFSHHEDTLIVKCFFLDATREVEAIEQANSIVRKFWGKVLGLN